MPPRDCFNTNPVNRNDFYFFYAEDVLVNQLWFHPADVGLSDDSERLINEAEWSDDDDDVSTIPPLRRPSTPFTFYDDDEFEREDLTGSDSDSDSDGDYMDEIEFPSDSVEDVWAREIVDELYHEYLLTHGTEDNPIDLTNIIE